MVLTCKITDKKSRVYDPLLTQLKQSIQNGEYPPGAMIGTEGEMALSAGVSRPSARQAVGMLIRDGLVERRPGKGVFVRRPHVITGMIQVIVPNLADDLHVQVIRGAQTLGGDHGMQVQVYDAHLNMEMDLNVLKGLPESVFDGAIIGAIHNERFAEGVYELKRAKYPFVLVDDSLDEIKVCSVRSDNYAGGYRIGQELARLGHRRLGFVGIFKSNTNQQRLAGLRDAVNDAGIPFDRTGVKDLHTDETVRDWSESERRCTREIMSLPDPPTAIFFSCDGVAANGYQALKAMGLRIPEDVSVVGFDDNPIARLLDPPLTTVRQQVREMGRAAMELLLDQMNNPESEPLQRVLPVDFVPRASTAPPDKEALGVRNRK